MSGHVLVVEWNKPNSGWVPCVWGATTKIKQAVALLKSAQREAHTVGDVPENFRLGTYTRSATP